LATRRLEVRHPSLTEAPKWNVNQKRRRMRVEELRKGENGNIAIVILATECASRAMMQLQQVATMTVVLEEYHCEQYAI
jgi:hypothetical protein